MRNAVQILFDDGSVQVIGPVAQPVPPPAPISSIIKGGYFDGIPDNQAESYADQFGMGWVRIWHGYSDYSQPPAANHPTFVRARALQAQGLKVLCVVTPIEKGTSTTSMPLVPTNSLTAYDFFSHFADAAGGCIDAFEVLNEPNLQNYNAGYNALANTVKFIQAPAYRALHGAGQFVVAGAPQEGATNLPYMIQNGFLDCGDAVAFHPYGANHAEQFNRVQNVHNLIGSKPLWVTEWNLHANSANPADWVQQLQMAASEIKTYVAAVFHFRTVQTSQAAGVAAPFDVSLNRRSVWYDGTVAAMGAF